MARIVHCRRTTVGQRFREWDAARGAYVTPELSQPPFRSYLMASGLGEDEADAVIRRAQMSGTSDPADKFNQDGGWNAEKTADAASVAP